MTARLIPLPFPECQKCGRSWGQCIHANYLGLIDVEPMSGSVLCNGCQTSWSVWESSFQCPCGALFEAGEIEDTLAELLDYCRAVVYEFFLIDKARERRADLAKESLREFLKGMMGGLGRATGMAVEVLLRFFTPH